MLKGQLKESNYLTCIFIYLKYIFSNVKQVKGFKN